jgi:hypothetical protein
MRGTATPLGDLPHSGKTMNCLTHSIYLGGEEEEREELMVIEVIMVIGGISVISTVMREQRQSGGARRTLVEKNHKVWLVECYR